MGLGKLLRFEPRVQQPCDLCEQYSRNDLKPPEYLVVPPTHLFERFRLEPPHGWQFLEEYPHRDIKADRPEYHVPSESFDHSA